MAFKSGNVLPDLKNASGSSGRDKTPSENYFSLKMITDKKTEMYVKFAKVMVIAQGPCTDFRQKTFKTIEDDKFKYTSCVVSDASFSKQTKTPCSYENTEEFYKYFKHSSQKALEEGNNLLVIDSSMSNVEQNRFYAALAYKMQYVIFVLPPLVLKTLNCSWPENTLACSYRKAGTIIQPTNMFQHLFFAWYLHDVDSHELRHEASLYIQDCIEGIPEFEKWISKICDWTPDSDEMPEVIDFVRKYYSMTDRRQDLAYCAVKTCGNSMKCMNDYLKRECVLENYGKMSKLYIAGFVISPHMIAARVKLTHNQRDLWDMADELNETIIEDPEKIPHCPSSLLQQSKKELPPVDIRLIASKSNQTVINTGRLIDKPLESIPHYGKGKACHIVLGKVQGACDYVDYDVQFALSREKKALKSKVDLCIEDLERCVVKRIGKYWYIYLKEMLSVDGFFASCVEPFPFDNPLK